MSWKWFTFLHMHERIFLSSEIYFLNLKKSQDQLVFENKTPVRKW